MVGGKLLNPEELPRHCVCSGTQRQVLPPACEVEGHLGKFWSLSGLLQGVRARTHARSAAGPGVTTTHTTAPLDQPPPCPCPLLGLVFRTSRTRARLRTTSPLTLRRCRQTYKGQERGGGHANRPRYNSCCCCENSQHANQVKPTLGFSGLQGQGRAAGVTFPGRKGEGWWPAPPCRLSPHSVAAALQDG